jgi:hypothetical protein
LIDSRQEPVVKRGEELLKKKGSSANLENPNLINRLFLLFNGMQFVILYFLLFNGMQFVIYLVNLIRCDGFVIILSGDILFLLSLYFPRSLPH